MDNLFLDCELCDKTASDCRLPWNYE